MSNIVLGGRMAYVTHLALIVLIHIFGGREKESLLLCLGMKTKVAGSVYLFYYTAKRI